MATAKVSKVGALVLASQLLCGDAVRQTSMNHQASGDSDNAKDGECRTISCPGYPEDSSGELCVEPCFQATTEKDFFGIKKKWVCYTEEKNVSMVHSNGTTSRQWGCCPRSCIPEEENTKIQALKPELGGCSNFAEDQFRAPDEDTCYIYMYRCADHKALGGADDHNLGDVAWALTPMCRQYGKYLGIYKIAVARPLMDHQTCSEGGLPEEVPSPPACRGGYEMCNHQICGCGLKSDTCGEDPKKYHKAANNFGWRQYPDRLQMSNMYAGGLPPALFLRCPCYQYSVPETAKGHHGVDAAKTLAFIQQQGWVDRATKANFQWTEEGHVKWVSIEDCIAKHIDNWNATTESIVMNFKAKVLDADGSIPECVPQRH
eukprot:TRINITY_DN27508_c0_g1_i1.p1 TRINITY_DN27508_c0_g1~~TRINITY_DN27508_c0_g1_i1.p1  ORF type:complete len:410 (-),score=75.50 TRINITY_DN27508_c0_g1_i1:78-1199(-)